jgi:hypothetical protein
MKKDDGTFGLINCMIEQKLPFEDIYQVFNERTDSQNGLILYKNGQGHILQQFGDESNLNLGASFL